MKFDPRLAAKHQLDILAALQPFVPDIALVGSMAIHGEGNDYDYVVFGPEDRDLADMQDDLKARGFHRSSPDSTNESGNEDSWVVLRKDLANVMLTTDHEFFSQFKAATQVCRYLALTGTAGDLSRRERIKIHRIIMNGEEA